MSNPRTPAWQPWTVCFSAALFFFYIFIQLNMFNAVNPSLMKTFHVGVEGTGNLSAYYFYADVLLLFPAGIILDRVSTRLLISLAMAVTVLAVILFSLSDSLWQASICRALMGVGGAFCLLSAVRLASRWFPPQRMALVIGLIVTMAMVGGMVAQTPLTLLTDHFGWRHAMLWDGLFGVILWFVVLIGVKDKPPGFKADHAISHGKFWGSLAKVLINPQNWLVGLFVSLMNLPVFLLGGNWGSLYLVEVDHLARNAASWVIMFFFLGLIIGSPVLGAWSDYWRRRKAPMLISSAAAIAVVLVMMWAKLSLVGVVSVFFLLGFITGAQVIGYPLIAESNPISLTGTAEGLGSVLIMAGGFTVPWFAALMDWHWTHHSLNGLPLYSVADFDLALAIMPIGFLIAFIASLFCKESHCQPYREK